jgi:hypothetical protein
LGHPPSASRKAGKNDPWRGFRRTYLPLGGFRIRENEMRTGLGDKQAEWSSWSGAKAKLQVKKLD